MLEIKNITKKFGGITALDDCSITITRGHITALVGPNGAGKTTLFDVITGLVKPEQGTVTLTRNSDQVELANLRPDQIAHAGISRTWQQVRLFKYLSIQDHLQLAESHTDTHLISNIISPRVGQRDKYRQILEEFGIDRPLKTTVSELSYGQRKLLHLAMSALQPHNVLLLDEPVAGVNAIVQERIEKLLLRWKEKNETIVVVEHDIEFVKRLADTVVVMDQGKVLVSGPPQQALQDKQVAAAYLGT